MFTHGVTIMILMLWETLVMALWLHSWAQEKCFFDTSCVKEAERLWLRVPRIRVSGGSAVCPKSCL